MYATNHIFFHDDIDGIICAALWLHEHIKENYRLYPVSSSMRGEKFDDLISSIHKLHKDDKKIVLDYQFHKEADVWVDHHFDPKFGEDEIKKPNFFYDPKSPSAARLLVDVSMPISGLDSVDMIDSGSYPDVDYIFQSTSPLMVLRAYLEKVMPSDMTYCRIVEVIANSDLDVETAIYRMCIGKRHVKILEANAREIKKSMIIIGDLSIVDQRRRNQFPRYSEYLVKPDVRYSLRLTRIGNNVANLQLGFNQFQKTPNNINIGKMLMDLAPQYIIRGGGHHNVGAGMLVEDNVDEFIDKLSDILNKGNDMEKLAVDATDPIELTASLMVKTGSVNSLDEARKQASEKTKLTTEDIDGSRKV